MAEMTGGQALVRSLRRHGLKVVFGLPGVQLDWAFDALYEARNSIHVYHTRHEQATSYMADGYTRTTGEISACLMVPGPGLMNALAGLSTAYACSTPVLCIAGQIPSNQIGAGRGLLHEVPNQLEMVGSATKWAGRAMSPQEVPSLVREAFRQLRSGRPRPVEIEIPPDVLQTTADVELLDPAPIEVAPGDPDLLEQAAKALGQAKQPAIVAGGGVLLAGAWEPLQELAKQLEAPVIMTTEGKGAISDRNYLAQNSLGGRELLPTADVILAVGTRFMEPWMGTSGPSPSQTIIQLDIDAEEIGRNHPATLAIVADAKLGLTALAERVGRHNHKRASREEELTAIKERVADRLFEIQPQGSYGQVIREELPDDGILLSGVTQLGFWNRMGFPVYQPRSYLTAGYQGTLGFEYATALGAQVGAPNRRVVAVCGDGGFMYNVAELSTAVRHGINTIAIVFNDRAFGNVLRMQRENFDGRLIASDLHNPDFVKLAESFGVEGMRANGPEGLRAALQTAFQHDNPVLIEVPVGELPSVWPILMPR